MVIVLGQQHLKIVSNSSRIVNNLPAVSNQTERLKHFSDNMVAITYPSDGKSFVLYQDKIIDKDATHYTELVPF